MNELKKKVKDFWDDAPCGTGSIDKELFTKEYYEKVEKYRYRFESEIFSFAQFTRYNKMKVLEVGVGMGTDFHQWIRAGAKAYGIDATKKGIEHTSRRLELNNVKPIYLKIGDAENLPFDDNYFDLVYSWGVIHHTPDTEKALREIVRVTRPGGECKVMVYNKHSLGTFYVWLKYAFLRGKPWKRFSWCLSNYQESPGTKAYTVKEIREMLGEFALEKIEIKSKQTYVDTLELSKKKIVRLFGGFLSTIFRDYFGWFLMFQFRKK